MLFEDVEELDFAGPWEVFRQAIDADPRLRGVHGGGDARCRSGARTACGCSPTARSTEAGRPDVIVVPGGPGTDTASRAIVDWIADADRTTTWTTSVCTGAFLLAAAGVATGRRVTTYHTEIDALAARGDTGPVEAGARWVHDGKVVTAAGVSAGIDMSLWLLGELRSPAFSRQVREWIEYDPAPPY